MKKHISAVLLGVALLVGVAGVLGGRMAHSAEAEEVDVKQLKKDIEALLQGQTIILSELKGLKEELNIVKIRCSS